MLKLSAEYGVETVKEIIYVCICVTAYVLYDLCWNLFGFSLKTKSFQIYWQMRCFQMYYISSDKILIVW